jgi:hypothetical protein
MTDAAYVQTPHARIGANPADAYSAHTPRKRPPMYAPDEDPAARGEEPSMFDELRAIGAGGVRGAAYDPLGADHHDTIASARAGASYSELQRAHQVDLNDAERLADLEDPGLVAHMNRARAQRAEHARQRAELPSAAALQGADADARHSLSALSVELKDLRGALQQCADEVLLHASNARKIAAGAAPHGYAAGDPPAAVAALGERVATSGDALTRTIGALVALERHLTLARRTYETVIDGLARRERHYEVAYSDIVGGAADQGGTFAS